MATSPSLLKLGAARCIVQQHVGQDMQVIACWQPPEGIYRCGSDRDASDGNFYFAVVEKSPRSIGATRHVAVDRHTGAIRELGQLGE